MTKNDAKNTAKKDAANTANTTPRLDVRKTYKLYINGAFPRSESGRTFALSGSDGNFVANVALASRKDLRDAVVAARAAASKWSSATAYNRGQILYRLAEVLESRSAELLGLVGPDATSSWDDAIDRVIFYAGLCDKLTQILSTVNPVSGPYLNLSAPMPVGVCFATAQDSDPLVNLLDAICAPLTAGATVIVLAPKSSSLLAVAIAEALAVSDVPAGVVNILTGSIDELLPVAADHHDIDLLDLSGASNELRGSAKAAAAGSIKCTFIGDNTSPLSRVRACTETRTIWHTVGV